VIGSTDPGYPAMLLEQPKLRVGDLFVAGDLTHAAPPAVAIVGTRDATPYGLRVTRVLATAFARAGVSVISGMARGVDAAAHRAALDAGGRTVAVLGTGIDVPYPAGHRHLHRTLTERACVVSESGPGVLAARGSFPRRNRIIAGMAKATIVVEAGVKSGALITAQFAEKMGRAIAAVPGPIDSPASAGCNQLCRDGAVLIGSVEEALSFMGVTGAREEAPILLSDVDGRVWKALSGGPLDPDAIAIRTRLTTRECLEAITSLELGGYVEMLLTGEVRRR
jgi:DNA processing protein